MTKAMQKPWEPTAPIFGDDAARVLGLQILELALFSLNRMIKADGPDEWPDADSDVSVALQIAVEEAQRMQQAIYSGCDADQMDWAMVSLACLINVAFTAYSPKDKTKTGRHLQRLVRCFDVFPELLEYTAKAPGNSSAGGAA